MQLPRPSAPPPDHAPSPARSRQTLLRWRRAPPIAQGPCFDGASGAVPGEERYWQRLRDAPNSRPKQAMRPASYGRELPSESSCHPLLSIPCNGEYPAAALTVHQSTVKVRPKPLALEARVVQAARAPAHGSRPASAEPYVHGVSRTSSDDLNCSYVSRRTASIRAFMSCIAGAGAASPLRSLLSTSRSTSCSGPALTT